MIKRVLDRGVLQSYVDAFRGSLDNPELRESVERAAAVGGGDGDPATRLRASFASEVKPQLGSSGSQHPDATFYLSRDPVHSLLQSTLEENLLAQGVPDETEHRTILSRIADEVKAGFIRSGTDLQILTG